MARSVAGRYALILVLSMGVAGCNQGSKEGNEDSRGEQENLRASPASPAPISVLKAKIPGSRFTGPHPPDTYTNQEDFFPDGTWISTAMYSRIEGSWWIEGTDETKYPLCVKITKRNDTIKEDGESYCRPVYIYRNGNLEIMMAQRADGMALPGGIISISKDSKIGDGNVIVR